MRRLIPASVSIALLAGAGLGCENLPGSRESQGAVIGGVAGAGAGAAISGENRLLGAIIGGALGAGGGYLIGAHTDWFGDPDAEEEARQAVREAQADPATAEDVSGSNDADLNQDGFVTLDEVIAMERAGLSDAEILVRLRLTDQVFELTRAQRSQLIAAGVSSEVVEEMPRINRVQRDEILSRTR